MSSGGMAWTIWLAVEAGVNSCKIFSFISVVVVGSRIPAHKFRKLLQLTRYIFAGSTIYLSLHLSFGSPPSSVYLTAIYQHLFCGCGCCLYEGGKTPFACDICFCRIVMETVVVDGFAHHMTPPPIINCLKTKSNQPTWLDITFSTWYKKTGDFKSNGK